MNMKVTPRQSMILAGLLQGLVMLALHEWFQSHGFLPSDLVWAIPAYVIAVLGPITFNFLRAEFLESKSLLGAAITVLPLAFTGAWFGWTAVPQDAQWAYSFSAAPFAFAATSVVVWFVGLPFIQARLREGLWRFPYPGLFDDAWRNAMLLTNGMVFTGIFWLLLMLWAGLFAVLQIGLFKELFTSRYFFFLATAMAISFAISLEEHEASTLSSLRRHALAFQTRLLPLAALIVVLFLAALPVSGLTPLWETGYATPLMLTLQIVIIALVNSAWQDGNLPPPFSDVVQMLVRGALALLPVLTALSVWSLYLRVEQYGWTVDRVWAAVIVGLVGLYAVGYAYRAILRGWLPDLGRINIRVALALITVLILLHSPLLDPRQISANSQVDRLLSGKADVAHFDYDHLRFNLGRAGEDALKFLSTFSEHPQAELIQRKAKEALKRTARSPKVSAPLPDHTEIANKLKVYPAEKPLPPGFIDYLVMRLKAKPTDYDLYALKGKKGIPVLAIDLGADKAPEYILLARPYPVFNQANGGWSQVGQLRFADYLNDTEISRQLELQAFEARPHGWKNLHLGKSFGVLHEK